jgi:hypothetical protein
VPDPIYALTVFFEEPVPEEDAADWAHAISMMRNVMKVEKHVQDAAAVYAELKARRDLEQRLWDALHGKVKSPFKE